MSRNFSPVTRRFLYLMEKHGLSRVDISDLLGCSLKTVSCWRCESPRAIPERELERLELKLEVQRLNTRLAYLEAGFEPPRSVVGVCHA